MRKLLILDKDGTLVNPKEGYIFPRHPQDQELLPGVSEAVAHYAADGWTMAIASNQGGCQWQKMEAQEVRAGQVIRHPLSPDRVLRVLDLEKHSQPDYQGNSIQITTDGNSLLFSRGKIVETAWKTLDDTIAEMRYCLQLLPTIKEAYFCPDLEGEECYCVSEARVVAVHETWRKYTDLIGTYRKPKSGMSELIIARQSSGYDYAVHVDRKECLFVGDRPEDKEAAIGSNIPFLHSDDWRKPYC